MQAVWRGRPEEGGRKIQLDVDCRPDDSALPGIDRGEAAGRTLIRRPARSGEAALLQEPTTRAAALSARPGCGCGTGACGFAAKRYSENENRRMLYDIQTPATAANAVILLNPRDAVAIARLPLIPGQVFDAASQSFTANQSVPAGHKVAIRSIAPGEPVLRYGEVIGFATAPISPGDHIHTHNLAFSEIDCHNARPEPVAPRG